MLPQLRRLERKYDRELVVIGIHSAKFAAERTTEAIRQAVQRHDVGHPVINDRDHRLWQAYAVRAWPTLVFIDPQGRIIGRREGELPFSALDRLVGQMVAEFDARGLLDRQARPVEVVAPGGGTGPLRFPGKVLADAAGSRLFVADTGHHRILVCGLNGSVHQVFGSGEPAWRDGPAEEAAFHHPQGLALIGQTLFVADTENHALRCIDLESGLTRTVAGTGEQAWRSIDGGPGRQVALNSPWGLAVHRDQLYVAMAGLHQVWAFNPGTGLIQRVIGSGYEGLEDGRLDEAQLAQPSDLASDGQRLFIACAEASAIRWADVESGLVGRLVGLGLFEFGDQDGIGPAQVRLQHPLGLTLAGGALYIADTYNHKIKRLDPVTATVTTVAGTGQPGQQDGAVAAASFAEPGGLSAAGERLFVADTDNHAIRVVDLRSGTVTTLPLPGLQAPSSRTG